MRRVLSEEEIYELIKTMPDKESSWIDNKNERSNHFRSILASGDRVEIIKLIKTIYQHKEELRTTGKKLHTTDEQFFREAEKVIYDEFALKRGYQIGVFVALISSFLYISNTTLITFF